MINYIKIKRPFNNSLLMVMVLIFSISFYSCEDYFTYDLPEAGSKPDGNPPAAKFSSTQRDGDAFLTYDFANLSDQATDYEWDFGDGNSSTAKDAINAFPEEGTYTITLTASDKLGATSTYSETIEVIEPVAPGAKLPAILEPSFEDLSLPDGTGDGRDSWRSDLGEIMQITSGPTYDGDQAAKFPSDGSRMAYQELEVSPNTEYILTYYYTMKEGTPGSITVAMLGGKLVDLADVPSQTLASFEGTDISDSEAYVKVKLPFNSGANETVAIYITNEAVECRIDAFSLELGINVLLPPVLEPSFEDLSLPDGTGDGRDSWRSDLGEIMQITSGPTQEGAQAAKFPSDGSRMAYQELVVTPNSDYTLTYWYTMKSGDPGSITVAMLEGELTDLANVASQTLASHVGTDQTDSESYVKVDLPFTSGDDGTVAIYITNAVIESRVDSFSLKAGN